MSHGLSRCVAVLALIALVAVTLGSGPRGLPVAQAAPLSQTGGAYATGNYPNLFKSALGKTDAAIQTKVDTAWNQLFYGDDANQRVYYPVGSDMAYIKDVGNNDVRSEGMSYGMMIAVQLNKKAEFDRLWKWAKTYMYQTSGPHSGYFAWQCDTNGNKLDQGPASDGEEYFVTALFFAAARWGNGSGILNYQAEANTILNTMLHKADGGVVGGVTNMFDRTHKQVVFVPYYDSATFTDPSYHLPAFYELWARWADADNAFWAEAATVSRSFFNSASHPTTGLTPDYANFDGTPKAASWNADTVHFRFDAWRTASNIAVDQSWFAANSSAATLTNRLLDFFTAQGISSYGNQYRLDGTRLSSDRSPGLIAMNAVAALAASTSNRTAFVQALWDQSIPSGQWRYYDGLLYMFGLLHVSGNFRIYEPGRAGTPTPTATRTPTITPTRTPTITPTRTPTPTPTRTPVIPSASVSASPSSVAVGQTIAVRASTNLGIPRYVLTVIDSSTGLEQSQTNPIVTPARPDPITGSSSGVSWNLTAVRPGTVTFRIAVNGEIFDSSCGCYYFTNASATSGPVTVGATVTPTHTPTPTAPGNLPDLVVNWLSIGQETPGCPPTPMGLNVTIANTGNAAAGPFSVTANGGPSTTVAGLAAGASISVWLPSYLSGAPNTATVDSANQVVESNEGNNTLSQMVAIPTPPYCPTATPTVTPTHTPTPTPGTGTCSPVTSTITAPFSYDGAGTFCWRTSSLGSYVNSWNLSRLTINGVDYTNRWANSYPPAIGGYWYISYSGPYSWSHFETR